MRKSIWLIFLQLLTVVCVAQIKIEQPLCENSVNPIGIDERNPQFSWQLSSPQRSVMQTAYEVRVADNLTNLSKSKNLQWNSGKIMSDQSLQVAYKGEALQSIKKYYWQVRVWDNKGNTSPWSEPASWQMGFLQASEWAAKWIKVGYTENEQERPSPLFRKTFVAVKKIKSATAIITSHGLYESFINGQRVGNAYFTPGFTSYNKRLQYQVYDVTNLLKEGNNAVGVALGNGWYRGSLAWNTDKYGKELSLLFQLNITYTDGTSDKVISNESWKSSTGDIRSSEIYHGETIDARIKKEGWNTASYNDAGWDGVKVDTLDKNNLVATVNEPVTKHERINPVKIFKTPSGEQVIDFGQNLVGFVQVKANGKTGDKIVIQHAEVLDKSGNFYTANLRAAKQTNTFILKGGSEEIFEPHFTFQGFRYIKIDGYPGSIKPENFIAVVLHSDMKPSGSFTTSNPLLNQLQHNIQWGQKGNFLDVPTDCPQRDERLGWTGDAQVFFNTAAYNFGVNNFFKKWMKDIAADQLTTGSVPFVIPQVLGSNDAGSAGWADAATIIPWNLYVAYGDRKILEDQYPSMQAWVNFMESKSQDDLWNTGFHFGDWLFYRPNDDNDGRAAITDKYLIAQCFYAYSTQLLINAASVLNKQADVQKYTALLERIKTAFIKEYMTANGRLVSGSQTAYVLALNFDMLPEDLRSNAAKRLVTNIKDYNYHLTTGFLGTPYLCHVLTRFGYQDVAYTLLMQETYPSWLYPVKMGATTIWERWDGQKPDSTFQTITMNSFNHYAYGAIGDWMYKVLAGINPDQKETGYKKIIIKPLIDSKTVETTVSKSLSSVAASLQTYYGKISSSWKKENGKVLLELEIPANTTADIYLPTDKENAITEDGKLISSMPSVIKIKEKKSDYILIEAGSGKYIFAF